MPCGDPPIPGYPYLYPTIPWPGETGHPGYYGRGWVTPTIAFDPPPARLSDEDVERIARRVVELLKENP